MSQVFKLFRLQQIDSQLDQVIARLEEIEEILSDDEELSLAQEVFESSKLTRIDSENKVRFAEEEVKGQEIKIEHNQASLYGGSITNPKELQDLQAEAESLKKHLSDLEDDQLRAMEILENAQSAEDASESKLGKLKRSKAKEHGDLLIEQAELSDERKRLEGEAEESMSSIPANDLTTYQNARERRKGIAVSKVENSACSACGNQLSQAILQAARNSDELAFCSTCRRIIYVG